MGESPIRVLVIEDQESDYLLTRRMLSASANQPYEIEWADGWETGVQAIRRCAHDVCLLDFRIGAADGLELLKESLAIGCKAPVILLTGVDDYRLDIEAMQLGAADFLVKDRLTPELLERSIRYAITQARSMQELRRREEQVRASEIQFRSVVQSAPDAIILSDESGKILFWNKGAERIFGYTEDEIVGAPIEALMPPSYRFRHHCGLERFSSTGRSHIVGRTVEMEGMRKDGTVFPLELSLASWTNRNGVTFTAVLRDISERKNAEHLQRQMNHDLRTPLQAILGFSNLLLKNKGGNLTEEDLDFIRRISANATEQLRILDSLNASKAERERVA